MAFRPEMPEDLALFGIAEPLDECPGLVPEGVRALGTVALVVSLTVLNGPHTEDTDFREPSELGIGLVCQER
jgi:hypothetical protein